MLLSDHSDRLVWSLWRFQFARVGGGHSRIYHLRQRFSGGFWHVGVAFDCGKIPMLGHDV